ncbi:MAG: hypothetical protein IJ525_03075 [Alphaproteobacteria bacterium]|nr:hypothetical protein [Alphaproteobacteria bacterium]
MAGTEEVRAKIAKLIVDKGLNLARVSLAVGKNIAYMQQFIKNGSPRRLGEVERRKLALILNVDEQELTDLPLSNKVGGNTINSEILALILEKIETWLINRNATLSPKDKADLVKLMYNKVCDETLTVAEDKVNDFIEIYDELRKAN